MSGRPGNLADRLLVRSPLHLVARRGAARSLSVLAYHGVPCSAAFARQIDLLMASRRPVDLGTVLAAVDGVTLPPSAALVTFDDLDRSVLENAVPVLRERGVPAVGFVVAGYLDSEEPFWWEEVEALAERGGRTENLSWRSPGELVRRLKEVPDARRLAAIQSLRETARRPAPRRRHLRSEELATLERAGIAIGNHTMTHPCLPQCPGDRIEEEIHGAHDALTDALGHEPRAFAYPNGDQDPRVVAAVAAAGYRAAFLFDHRPCRWPPADPLRISRLRTNPQASPDRFRLILSGLHPFLHHALGRP